MEHKATLTRVFEPFRLKGVTIANRIIRTSMGSGHTVGGMMSEASWAWHMARVKGGMGLIYTDPAAAHWSSPAFLDATREELVASLQPFTSAVHAEGCRVFTQIMHGGPTNIPVDGTAPWGPSAVPDPGLGMLSVPMTEQMIADVIAGFAGSARRLRDGGIDGVEIHAGHGYLFSAFLSPATNQRSDRYGGSVVNRRRLLVETLEAVRLAVGASYPVGIRVSPDGPDDQSTIADTAVLVETLERDGLIDFVNVSWGSHYGRDLLMGAVHEPHGYQLEVVRAVRPRTTLPLIATGRFTSLAEAEAVLESGLADLVSLQRATIADPDLVNKTRKGRVAEIRPCIYCNQACAGGLATRGKVTCTVNPGAGRELTHGDAMIPRSLVPGHLVIIGGGPAGLEAARTGAVAGHRVTLVEAADEVGGQLRLVRRSPHRSETFGIVDWYRSELERLGVTVHLNQRWDRGAVLSVAPDAVIVATGATPRRDGFQTWLPGRPLPGLDRVSALTGWDVLQGAAVGPRVLLLDEIGHYETLDVAETLVEAGHTVHLVTRFAVVAANLEMRWEMVGGVHMSRFLKGDLRIHARSLLLGVEPGRATIAPIESRHLVEDLDVDTHVLMSGSMPDRQLADAMAEVTGVPVRVVGDAAGPRLLEAAVFEGNQAVRSLEPGAPLRWPGARFGQTGSAI
jgi:2,4-dienoyl-CoA reductase-like NADH-dependent reductase (Old Yellow Enzyme family)